VKLSVKIHTSEKAKCPFVKPCSKDTTKLFNSR
jgi:hypothetical protein